MYDNAELDSTFSERARETWVVRTASSSATGGLQPRLANSRDGGSKTSVLVLTEELEGKIQTALAIGCGYRSALQDAQKWRRRKLMQQADIAGTLESFKHRLSVKRSEIISNKEPTVSQKKTLETLSQNVERLKASQAILEENLTTGERNLVHGLNRWRKAWADVDKILVKVWRDAGRLVPNDDSEGDDENPTRDSGSKDKERRKRAHPSNNDIKDILSAMLELDSGRQKRAERQRREVLSWRHSVESSSQASMVDAQSPGNRQSTKRANLHDSRRSRRRHQSRGSDIIQDHLGYLAPSTRDQQSVPQPCSSREHHADYNNLPAHESHPINRHNDKQPSPIISQHSSMLPPPSMESRHSPAPSVGMQNGTVRHDAHQERRRDGRSRSPRRDRLPSRDTLRYRDRESHEKKPSGARDESLRARERSCRPEEDRGRCM